MKWRSNNLRRRHLGFGVEDGIIAFTDFGIENRIELIRSYKEPQAAQAPKSELQPAPDGYFDESDGVPWRGQVDINTSCLYAVVVL